MRRKVQSGFTLIEVVIALVLLAMMLGMAWSGLSFVLRGWDAGADAGHRTADQRLAQNFLRRELMELFPMRWKDAMMLKFAFQGDANALKFVSSRPAGLSAGGLALVGLAVEPDGPKKRNLVMRRALPDADAKDFGPLDKAEGVVLYPDIDSITFDYFGAESDLAEPKWHREWTFAQRIPDLVRLKVKTSNGEEQPEFIAKIVLGQEAGCLESSFQRTCRPRVP